MLRDSRHLTLPGFRRRRMCRGFSTVELLVASAILIVLAAVAAVSFTSYMDQVNTDLSGYQQRDLIDHIDVSMDMIQSGAGSGLVSPSTGARITNDTTCAEFLDSLRVTVAHLRNPYDGSPAVTFSTDYAVKHKRGKFRITCYRLHRHSPANGGTCTMRNAGIRVTHFLYDCGGKCGASNCIYPSADCGDGVVIDGWNYGAQTDTYFGKSEIRFLTHDNGSVKYHANGDPMVDVAYGQSVCPGYSVYTLPKEENY